MNAQDTRYYGFKAANREGDSAWFHTYEAACRFANACGWNNTTVDRCCDPDPADIMDTPDRQWQPS